VKIKKPTVAMNIVRNFVDSSTKMTLVHIFIEKCGPCEIVIKRTRAYCTSDFGELMSLYFSSAFSCGNLAIKESQYKEKRTVI